MEFLKNSTPQAEPERVVVTGATLSEAFKNVRQRFGLDAVIAETRTRQLPGDRNRTRVEVTVSTGGDKGQEPRSRSGLPDALTAEIRYEVERLERMVEDIIRPQEEPAEETPAEPGDPTEAPLTEYLLNAGASVGAVDRLLTRFSGETGQPRSDRPGAITWLGAGLGAGPGPLPAWEGTHAILHEHAPDRLDLMLRLAVRLTEAGRRVLAVAVLADPERDLARLQCHAEAGGFDAAVVREPHQLEDLAAYLPEYDLVLVDLPALGDPAMADGGTIHRILADKTGIQRHLRLGLDRDFLDLHDLRDAARRWGCDWLALDRVEGTRRPAKILDLLETIPLPVSLLADDSATQGHVAAATVEGLLDLIFTADTDARFTPGLAATGV